MADEIGQTAATTAEAVAEEEDGVQTEATIGGEPTEDEEPELKMATATSEPKWVLANLDESQVFGLFTEDEMVKAQAIVGEIVCLDNKMPKEPKLEGETVKVPVEYLLDFFNKVVKKAKVSHIRLTVKTDSPLKMEFLSGEDKKTVAYLAPRIEAD
jgi:hypothetical protein